MAAPGEGLCFRGSGSIWTNFPQKGHETVGRDRFAVQKDWGLGRWGQKNAYEILARAWVRKKRWRTDSCKNLCAGDFRSKMASGGSNKRQLRGEVAESRGSFSYSFIYSASHSFSQSVIRSFSHSGSDSVIHSFCRFCVHSVILSASQPFNQSAPHSFSFWVVSHSVSH